MQSGIFLTKQSHTTKPQRLAGLAAAGAAAILLLAAQISGASAQASDPFPSKVIKIIVPVVPGGLADLLARAVAQHLTTSLKQQVIVENKPGGNLQIGVNAAISSPADGHTLLVAQDGAIVVNPHLYSKLSYDPLKDLVPISGIAKVDQVLVVNPTFPAKTVRELIQYVKERPNQISFGTFGPGSPPHLHMSVVQYTSGVQFVPVQYKGAAPMLADVVANHIPMTFISLGQGLPLHREGKVRIIAVGTAERLDLLPDVPTLAESGVSDFSTTSWFGLFAPAGTPPDVVLKINGELQKLAADPNFREKILAPSYFRSMVSSPQEFVATITAESDQWKNFTKAIKLQIE